MQIFIFLKEFIKYIRTDTAIFPSKAWLAQASQAVFVVETYSTISARNWFASVNIWNSQDINISSASRMNTYTIAWMHNITDYYSLQNWYFNPTLYFILNLHSPILQVLPLWLGGQWHLKPLIRFEHDPPLLQGLERQCSISEENRKYFCKCCVELHQSTICARLYLLSTNINSYQEFKMKFRLK